MSDPQHPAQNPHQLPPYVSQQPPAGYPGQPQGYPQQHQPQHQPQPQQPEYTLNGQNFQPGASASRVGTASANPAGRIGVILGIVAIALEIVLTIVAQVLFATGGFDFYEVINLIFVVLILLAALAALILGFVGLRRPGAPHGAAGIAVGIGLAMVIGYAFSYGINAIGSMFYF